MKSTKENKGITIIALIITIVEISPRGDVPFGANF
jgi:hypothetical protein